MNGLFRLGANDIGDIRPIGGLLGKISQIQVGVGLELMASMRRRNTQIIDYQDTLLK